MYVCKLFEINCSSFQRWCVKQKKTGSLVPKYRRKSPYKIDNNELKSYINKNPAAYLNDIVAHFKVAGPFILFALDIFVRRYVLYKIAHRRKSYK